MPYPDLGSDDDEEVSPIKKNEHIEVKKKLVHEIPTLPSSPMLNNLERKEAKEFGYSLDTKLLNDEFFFIDLEKMCFCLSIAIQRQIHFARGFLLLDDLATYLKTGKSETKMIDPSDLSASENELKFSYWFPDHLKLNHETQGNHEKMDCNKDSDKGNLENL